MQKPKIEVRTLFVSIYDKATNRNHCVSVPAEKNETLFEVIKFCFNSFSSGKEVKLISAVIETGKTIQEVCSKLNDVGFVVSEPLIVTVLEEEDD